MDGQQPKFAQVYMFDGEDELNHRLGVFGDREIGSNIVPEIVQGLTAMFDMYNEVVEEMLLMKLMRILIADAWLLMRLAGAYLNFRFVIGIILFKDFLFICLARTKFISETKKDYQLFLKEMRFEDYNKQVKILKVKGPEILAEGFGNELQFATLVELLTFDPQEIQYNTAMEDPCEEGEDEIDNEEFDDENDNEDVVVDPEEDDPAF
ncbi:hypothetical protein COLO4_24710 [Corchorus olitorius]|uniref:Uncharacterized protein n=1 Tax=Corchorus olitorius TaxID=93759 RepID=A0A1R3I7P5_9ROSI|nr:hypothetical protein COLO4_24710 [Corchorus olitorius]